MGKQETKGDKTDEPESELDLVKWFDELPSLSTEHFSTGPAKENKTGRPLRLKDDDYTRDKLHYLAAVGFTQKAIVKLPRSVDWKGDSVST